jgi:hypothetical protein
MALYRRGHIWYYEFWFDGVRFQGSTRQSNKREAERIIAALKADVARRRVNLPSKSVKFQEISDRYEELSKTDGRPSYVSEKYHIKNRLVPYFGDILVHALNREIVEKYKRKRLRDGVERGTINRELSTMRSILNYATECGLAPEDAGRKARFFLRSQGEGEEGPDGH